MPSADAINKAAVVSSDGASVTASMTSRYLDLIVVPGKHILKIELEVEEAGNS